MHQTGYAKLLIRKTLPVGQGLLLPRTLPRQVVLDSGLCVNSGYTFPKFLRCT